MTKIPSQFRLSPETDAILEEEAARTGYTKTRIVEACIQEVLSAEARTLKQVEALLQSLKMDCLRMVIYLKKEELVPSMWLAKDDNPTNVLKSFVLHIEGTPSVPVPQGWVIEFSDKGTTLKITSATSRPSIHLIPVARIVRLENG